MEVIPGYKQTDIGVIPKEWEAATIGDVASFSGGSQPPRYTFKFTRTNGYIRLIQIRDYKTDEYASFIPESMARKRCTVDDIMIGRYGPPIFQILRGIEGAYNVALLKATPNQRIDREYFFNVLRQDSLFQLIDSLSQRSSGQTGVEMPALKAYGVPLPPPLEQRAIAKALSDADALVVGLDQIIAKKRDLKQATMQQLLTSQTRLPGFHGEWPVKTFGELFNFSGGYSASRDQLSNEGHSYLHYGDIHGATKTSVNVQTDYQDIPKLNIPLKRVSSKSLLEDGDVVFVDASEDDEGTSRHLVVVNKENIPFISGLHTIVAKSKTDELTHEYRHYCFQTSAVRQQFLFYAVGTKVSGISKTNIAKLTIPVPKVPEQTAIAKVLSDMDAELAALEQRRDKTRALKQGMMQELLTGRTRLISTTSNIIQFPDSATMTTESKTHNWQINEAVVIAVFTKQFGTEKFPLGRKRYTKLSYLLHRHVEKATEGYLKKAAGPYNPSTKYKGPEAIAKSNGYIRAHNNPPYSGFIASNHIAKAEAYFQKWYGAEVLQWLEQFRFKSNDELELLATVDMAMEDLRRAAKLVELATVKQVILDHPEWEAKLARPIFSDANISRTMQSCRELFA